MVLQLTFGAAVAFLESSLKRNLYSRCLCLLLLRHLYGGNHALYVAGKRRVRSADGDQQDVRHALPFCLA